MTDWIFFGPAKLIAAWPYAGLLLGVLLIAVQVIFQIRRRAPFDRNFFREATVFAGLLWVLYGFYEMQVAAAMTTAAANAGTAKRVSELFRLDLIVLVPILYLMSAFAVGSIVRQLRAGGKP
jgi:hypothetical protein